MKAAMLQLSRLSDVFASIARAKEVAVCAYTLQRPVLDALEAAARKGTRVVVELEGRPYGNARDGLAGVNARYANELRAAGVKVSLADAIHAKTIEADGVLYLDGKNFDGGDLILREDDRAAAAAIPKRKDGALAEEARLLAGAKDGEAPIAETESIGTGNVTYVALRALAHNEAAPRLLVSEDAMRRNPRERAVLADLQAQGVRVRVCGDSEKLAVAGNRAWLGSANATYPKGKWAMSDWGLCTASEPIVNAVRDRLEREWSRAKDFAAAAKA